MLSVFDQQEKLLIMIDSKPVEEWCKEYTSADVCQIHFWI
jgi:hypothetical protein